MYWLDYTHILIGSYSWCIGGLMNRWHHHLQRFVCLSYRTNRSHVVAGLYSYCNRLQKMSKCSWNISDTLSCTLCVNCFVLTPFWHYLWSLTITDAQQCGVCLLKSGHVYLKVRHIHTLCLQIQLLRFYKLCVLHCHLFQERKQETEFSNPLHLEIQDCKKSMNHQFFNNQEMKHTVPWPKSSNLQN